jgi:hypothetical protein
MASAKLASSPPRVLTYLIPLPAAPGFRREHSGERDVSKFQATNPSVRKRGFFFFLRHL